MPRILQSLQWLGLLPGVRAVSLSIDTQAASSREFQDAPLSDPLSYKIGLLFITWVILAQKCGTGAALTATVETPDANSQRQLLSQSSGNQNDLIGHPQAGTNSHPGRLDLFQRSLIVRLFKSREDR